MSQKSTLSKKDDSKQKEELFLIYYKLQAEIKNQKIEKILPDKDDFLEILKSTKLNIIINYLKEVVDIYIKLHKKPSPSNDSTFSHNLHHPTSSNLVIESLLHKAEHTIRCLHAKIFNYRLQMEVLDTKILNYKEMEAEYRAMKELYKYENGKFLSNDRKDNEIVILRKENSNLKKKIDGLEQEIKIVTSTKNEHLKSVTLLNKKVQELSMKIAQMKSVNTTNSTNGSTETTHRKLSGKINHTINTQLNTRYLNSSTHSSNRKTKAILSPFASHSVTNIHNACNQTISYSREKAYQKLSTANRRNFLFNQCFSSTNQSSSSFTCREPSSVGIKNNNNIYYKKCEPAKLQGGRTRSQPRGVGKKNGGIIIKKGKQ